jgi:hypothetical protein
MNHLRELLETSHARRAIKPTFLDSDAVKIMALFDAEAEHSMCFDIGELDIWEWMSIIRDNARMPFSYCWFEMHFLDDAGQQQLCGCLVTKGVSSSSMKWWRRFNGLWSLRGFAEKNDPEMFTHKSGADGIVYRLLPHDESIKEEWEGLHGIISAFLSALNCTNINRVEHVREEKLQRARVKRGKKPLFSYWTLELQAHQSERRAAGGTHASPRLHLRRGHARQYAPGKYTWVQPHVVGNKALGIVHKDYDGSRLSTATGGMVMQ